jgi:hypothetical protein
MAAAEADSTERMSMPAVMVPVISFSTPTPDGATTPARFPNEFTRAIAVAADVPRKRAVVCMRSACFNLLKWAAQ